MCIYFNDESIIPIRLDTWTQCTLFCVFVYFYSKLMHIFLHNTRRKQANQKFAKFSQNRFCKQECSLKLEIFNISMAWICCSYRKNTLWKNWNIYFRVLWSIKNYEKIETSQKNKNNVQKMWFLQFRLDSKSFQYEWVSKKGNN